MPVWTITEWDGLEEKSTHELPGSLSQKEIKHVLQRLVCRDLSISEILNASRRKSDPMRNGLLDAVSTDGRIIDYGHANLHYSAEYRNG